MWLAVAGVAAVLTAYPAAFTAVQWLGAAYLAYLGVRMLLAKPGDAPVLNIRPRHYIRQALHDHAAQPEGHRVLHGVFPAVRRPGHAPHGLMTFGFMAFTIAVLTFAYAAACPDDPLPGGAFARQPPDRRGAWKNWPACS
jgi:leucine efflux protein